MFGDDEEFLGSVFNGLGNVVEDLYVYAGNGVLGAMCSWYQHASGLIGFPDAA
ncbi:Uncharacterised protein [Dermatophilus congolensis]|uniref:Uncharacterized protein n=1 Tax=Dermatophilus congolensis TaxID=1863 RepID=A0AA46BQH2_9MICO|nr:hypothetical protein [Dermatophilus congolensis]STD15768.1 Uncharacterised protein [Dermatophilus congolensis]